MELQVAIDGGLIGPTTMGLTQSISLFQGFLPKFNDIRKEDPTHNPDFVQDVRMGELAAALLTLGIGAVMSSLTGTPYPALISLVSCLGLIALYETALRSNSGTAVVA
jgi:hypothetical protein